MRGKIGFDCRVKPYNIRISIRSDSDSGAGDSRQSASASATCTSNSLEFSGAHSASLTDERRGCRGLNNIVRNSPVEGSCRKISTTVEPSMSGNIASTKIRLHLRVGRAAPVLLKTRAALALMTQSSFLALTAVFLL